MLKAGKKMKNENILLNISAPKTKNYSHQKHPHIRPQITAIPLKRATNLSLLKFNNYLNSLVLAAIKETKTAFQTFHLNFLLIVYLNHSN